eukprot:GEMP01083178.1.p1 GENE.GEMP01083178.1~~GEMP01083178.1.p1  ORF type:complete len:120 (+),score=23.00 GEMP01083178.1:555-914(+)
MGYVTLRCGNLVEHYHEKHTEEGYWFGKVLCTGEVGKFPLVAMGRVTNEPQTVCGLYPFYPKEDDIGWIDKKEVLSFDAGAIFTKLCVHNNSDQWSFGKLDDGRMGWFPTNYVDLGVEV